MAASGRGAEPATAAPAEAQLATATERLPGGLVQIRVDGDLDLATAPQLRTAVLAAVTDREPPDELRVDLAGIHFIDAVGVGELMRSRQAARRVGVDFSVCCAHGLTRRLLEIFHLVDVLKLAPGGVAPPEAGDAGSR